MYLNSPFLGNSGVLFTFLGRNELKYAGFEVHPKSWTKNWGAHYEVQKTWY